VSADRLAEAWALKAECHAAWSVEPSRVAPLADRLAALAAADGRAELAALADWTRGIAELAGGRLAQAATCLEQAHARFLGLGDVQHAAETRVPQLIALSMLGRHDEALRCAEAALAQFVAAGDERSAGKVELNLGTMLTRQDRHGEAAAHYRRAAVRFAHVGDLQHSVMADIGLADALTWQFEMDEAALVNQRARMRAATHGLAVLEGQAQVAIGRLALHQGRLHTALRELAQASQRLEDAGAAPQQRFEADKALADAYLAVNLLPEAAALYDRLGTIARDTGAPLEQARALVARARAQAGLGQDAAAQAGFDEARRLFSTAGSATSTALADLGLGALHLRGGRPAEAADHARRAQASLADSGILAWLGEARLLEAEALSGAGRTDEAVQVYRAVLADCSGQPRIEWAARLGLARQQARAGQTGAARAELERALSLIDEARAALPDDEFRSAMAHDAERGIDLLVELALEACPADGSGAADDLLECMERGRGRSWLVDAGTDAGSAPEAVDAPLRARLLWARERWRKALPRGDGPELASRAGDVALLESQLLEAHRRAAAATQPSLVDGGVPAQRFSVHGLQHRLAPGQALVEYHRLGDRLTACVATPDGTRAWVWEVPGLDQRLEALQFQLEAPRWAGQRLSHHAALLQERVMVHLQGLYRVLWAPLAEGLAGVQRVVVVPHRELHYVPFAALHDGRAWLVERVEISLSASAGAWMRQAGTTAGAPERVLAVGHGGEGLPHVEAEIAAVAVHVGHGARTLVGTQATQHAVSALAPDVDVLHLACHGQFRADSPYFSALHLADGPWTLHDVRQQRLTRGLVVLSACETGLSRLAPGEERLGLVRGFMQAGARAVMATLWAVDDASSAGLMADFYDALSRGQRAAGALQFAQIRAARAGNHPFRWAAMSLHGPD